MVLEISKQRLARVFGLEISGDSPDEYARRSQREFYRSQDHLAPAREGATGRRLSAWEANRIFGFEKLEEALEFGSAVIVSDPRQPAATIRKRREMLGLDPRDVARVVGVDDREIERAEDPKQTNPIQLLEKISQALALNESRLSTAAGYDTDEGLAIRLRRIRNSRSEFNARTVLSFGEAAWVIQKQTLLAEWLDGKHDIRRLGFETDSRYGDKSYPVWNFGYELARSTRRLLNIPETEPIQSLRDLAECELKIPLINLELPTQFAGATLATESARGIAVNVKGQNENVWVRRATIAHELGHLLWDPDQSLQSLLVDTYDDLESNPPQKAGLDPIEARANAFAIELLAPQQYALEVFQSFSNSSDGIRGVMEHFGVSFTSAKFQLWNALDRSRPLESFSVGDVDPTDDWKGREEFTNDFFRPESVPLSRRGQFSFYVVRAVQGGLISKNSGAAFLGCTESELVDSMPTIMGIFARP